MFMDVSLPLSQTAHPDPTAPPDLALSPVQSEDSHDNADGNTNGNKKDKSRTTPPLKNNNNNIQSSSDSEDPSAPPSRPHAKNHMDSTESLDIPQPILTIAVFSASEIGKSHKSLYDTQKAKGSDSLYNPSKHHQTGDSDDAFLGMASIDLTTVLTGKYPLVDAWVPLTGGSGSVRVVCEYETTDIAPAKGDLVKFTRFCHPADLHPLVPGRTYPVQDVIDQDHVVLSYTSPEGWVCSFVVHRFMVLCTERHHGAAEACREEWQSITEKLAHSPLVGTVAETVERLPEEGLFTVGASVLQGGAGLLGRWLEGGLDTAVKDVAFVTNWDGRFNPGSQQRPTSRTAPTLEDNTTDSNDNTTNSNDNTQGQTESQPVAGKKPPPPSPPPVESSSSKDPLPNMPSCPITGEPMLDPVVAADGHTYERAAIARWLQASDKSPLTGSILPHKELVPNYGLLSSLQEQADARQLKPPPPVPVTANIAIA